MITHCISTYNNLPYLKLAVESVRKYSYWKDAPFIIHAENCSDGTLIKKYNQLKQLGIKNIYVYIGGLFEWLLLQDIYGKDEFPTTTEIFDILKYKGDTSNSIRTI